MVGITRSKVIFLYIPMLSFQRALFHWENPMQGDTIFQTCDMHSTFANLRIFCQELKICGLSNIFAKQERTRLTSKMRICTRVYFIHYERTRTAKVVKCWMPQMCIPNHFLVTLRIAIARFGLRRHGKVLLGCALAAVSVLWAIQLEVGSLGWEVAL